MDDLVYICTKIARQMDVQGLDRVFDAAEAATAAVEEARPLLQRVVELVDEVRTRVLVTRPFWSYPGAFGARGRCSYPATLGNLQWAPALLSASCKKPAATCFLAMQKCRKPRFSKPTAQNPLPSARSWNRR